MARNRTLPVQQEESSVLKIAGGAAQGAAQGVEFDAGFVYGFGQGTVGLVTGAWDLVKMTGHGIAGAYHYLQNVGVRYVDGDTFDQEKDFFATSGKGLEAAAKIFWKFNVTGEAQTAIIDSILAGDYAPLEQVSPEFRQIIETSVEVIKTLWDKLNDTWANASPWEKGRYVGRAVFEIAAVVLPMTKLGAITKLKVLTELKNLAQAAKLSEPLAAAVTKLGEVGGLIEKLATTKMCFVAGTPVMTALGLVPIQNIRPGDMVLSRDEATGEQGYKPVLQTVTTHPDALYTVTYDRDGSGPIPAETVTTTAPHPFYVTNRDGDGDGKLGGFVPADELRPGDELSLADRSGAEIESVTIQHAAAGTQFATYNFEVADYHTYFVNDDGVWVHNIGANWCETAYSIYNHVLGEGKREEEAVKAIQTILDVRRLAGGATNKEYYQALGAIVDKISEEENLFPGVSQLWSSNSKLNNLQNLGEHFSTHVLKEQQWGNDITDILSYARRARVLITDDSAVTHIGTIVEKGIIKEVRLNATTSEPVIRNLNGPESGAIRTFFKRSQDPVKYFFDNVSVIVKLP